LNCYCCTEKIARKVAEWQFDGLQRHPIKKRTFIAKIGNKTVRNGLGGRVARWYIFKPKVPIWVNFGGP
jgi:hypothetical protein